MHFFKEKLVTQCFVCYIGWTSSNKSKTQCTMYLKAKNKTSKHNGGRQTTGSTILATRILSRFSRKTNETEHLLH